MNKFLPVLLGAILLTSLSACVPSDSHNPDSEQAYSAAAAIADFDLPDGYSADFRASLMGYTAASFRSDDEHSHLYLIQSAKESDGEELAQMLEQVAPGASDPWARITVIETRLVAVRGQETIMIISEGINSDGETYRQATVAFQGKGGPALLMLSEPAASWDQEAVDAIVASIR